MKVLHVVWNLGQGGTQTYLRDLAKACLGVKNISLCVLVLTKRGPLSDDIEGLGIPVIYLNIKSGVDFNGFTKLFNYLRITKYDIIHSHSSNLLFNCILWFISSPKVFTEHGGGLMGGEWKYYLIYKLFYRNYAQFIAISKASAAEMKAANPKIRSKTRIVYNGLDIEVTKAVNKDYEPELPQEIIQAKCRVGIIGRLVPQKGISLFLAVAAVLAESETDMVFVIVGDGPLQNELEKKSEELGIKDKVFFLGFRKDAKQILKLFDVFLFTSEWEPFGLVIIEAMALGVPVVALNNKGAVNEIITNGIDGLVIDKAEPTLLAQLVVRLLSNEGLRKEIAENAYTKVVEHFTIQQNAQQLVKVYNDCVSG